MRQSGRLANDLPKITEDEERQGDGDEGYTESCHLEDTRSIRNLFDHLQASKQNLDCLRKNSVISGCHGINITPH